MNISNLAGNVYGQLTVISLSDKTNKRNQRYWLCKCSCNNESIIIENSLKSGNTKSCGCSHTFNKKYLLDLKGKRFSKLTAIEYKTKSRWLCKCDCGNEKIIKTSILIHNENNHCGCMNLKVKDLTGKKFKNLEVLSLAYTQKEKGHKMGAFWLCKCHRCGNEKIMCSYSIRHNSDSCGCYLSEYAKLRPFEARYNILKRHTKKWRGHDVSLTYEDYFEFTKIDKCHYCDKNIIWQPYTGNHCTSYRINLDRKDNNVGYTKDNCVVCCWECNEMKGNRLSYSEMLILKPLLIQIRQDRELNPLHQQVGPQYKHDKTWAVRPTN